MLGRPNERRQIDGYIQVGPPLGAESPDINYDDAEELRRVVTLDLFDVMEPKTSLLSEIEDKTFAARLFRPVAGADDENDTTIFGGAMVHHEEGELWRMKVLLTRSARMPHNLGEKKIQTRYFLGALAGELIVATKQVKAVREVGEAAPDLISSGGNLRRVRRAYEKNMSPDDCEMLHESLARIIKRARVSSRR
jgi:hypothetical protein